MPSGCILDACRPFPSGRRDGGTFQQIWRARPLNSRGRRIFGGYCCGQYGLPWRGFQQISGLLCSSSNNLALNSTAGLFTRLLGLSFADLTVASRQTQGFNLIAARLFSRLQDCCYASWWNDHLMFSGPGFPEIRISGTINAS